MEARHSLELMPKSSKSLLTGRMMDIGQWCLGVKEKGNQMGSQES